MSAALPSFLLPMLPSHWVTVIHGQNTADCGVESGMLLHFVQHGHRKRMTGIPPHTHRRTRIGFRAQAAPLIPHPSSWVP
ncbi:hypothetical protein BDP55DRAFT_666049 [Colletotrichum godetiae]|uniref:Secreted protein n=1 Tax=Colletotrichum godetiae TaxID=1209918 RepID=A0AAJ0AN14_9PEZI|nr:uncharacterized protein BDP55DRAFT_666049 [Colletotrichum godetiae]KAK1674731.1 hypothetical protein BDP55DRAFT_666049 [Colletotrichum godetiae]